jgi:hypothetical protein
MSSRRWIKLSLVIDHINQSKTDLEWKSLGYILSHLYWQKTNDDGSEDVKLFSNHVYVTNESAETITFHISKEETRRVSIASVSVDGDEYAYQIMDGILILHVEIPALSSAEIQITYQGG